MKQEKNVIIILLVVLVIILAVLCVLLATGTINFKNEEVSSLGTDNQQSDEIIDTNTGTVDDYVVVSNTTIDKYLGKWLLAGQDYSNIVIKKNDDYSGYKIDILVNKEADYKDLKLNCADDSGACYFSGDAAHNYSIMMANDTILVLPDYGTAGYWTFNK